jgi:hypothetical protein
VPRPAWLEALIASYQAEPPVNPPRAIWKYEFQGSVVFYVPAPCCDQFSELRDARGVLLCAPDGGLAGRGDGRCRDFLAQRTREELVWRDPRGR